MKKAIITGGSSGLGLELAKLLVSKGVEVVNVSRSECELDVTNIKCDLAKDKDISDAIKAVKKDHKDADVFILNAAIMSKGETGEIESDIDNEFHINITSIIKLVNGLIGLIKKNESDVVLVGSTSSFVSYGGDSVYVATKHALLGYVKALQAELKKENVRVIGFHPGGFNSNLRGGVQKEGYMDPKDLAGLMMNILELPRGMEVSEIIINRNKGAL